MIPVDSTLPTGSILVGGDPAHIGFGGGIHFCVGAPLARQELAVALSDLSRWFTNLELAAEPVHHPTFVHRGLTELRLASSPNR